MVARPSPYLLGESGDATQRGVVSPRRGTLTKVRTMTPNAPPDSSLSCTTTSGDDHSLLGLRRCPKDPSETVHEPSQPRLGSPSVQLEGAALQRTHPDPPQ